MNDKYLEHFVYLDNLRQSGKMNMMGAPRELQNDFNLDKAEARKIFGVWANQFNGAKNPDIYTQRRES